MIAQLMEVKHPMAIAKADYIEGLAKGLAVLRSEEHTSELQSQR